jgi:hypothetical protein
MRLLLALIVLLVLAPAAQAGEIIDRAASALRDDNVYVDPEAEAGLSASEAQAVRDRIESTGAGPMYVAVLPEAALSEGGGNANGVLRELNAASQGRAGTYVVVAGRTIRAGSNDLPAGDTRRAIDAAVDVRAGEGLEAILLDFADRMGAVRAGEAAPEDESGDGGGDGSGALILLGVGALGAGAVAVSRRRRRQAAAAELTEAKDNVRDDLVLLGDQIRALDLDMQMPNADPAAKEDYALAVERYQEADDAWEVAKRPEDLEPVGRALEEGRWAMASAQARLEGREPPEHRAPCFFDPRHGPSSREVEWSPPYGAPRLVPACEADAQMVERGEEPAPREVVMGGQRTPYWNAGPAYAPYAGGVFGGFGGLFPGILIGSMLGGAMFPPIGYGDYSGGDMGGGDFGGGGFGGGDFGGGGFGGGDFGGGGGFGGGDF